MARPTVSIVLCRNRLLDKENAYGSTKPVTDGIVKAGFVPNDTEEAIELHVNQEKTVRGFKETIITIDYGGD